jgi:DNA relaxase NicK
MNIKVFTKPLSRNGDYFSYEIPGKACDCIHPDRLIELGDLLHSNYKDAFKFNRLDYAFDNVPFTPKQAYDAVKADQLRTLAKRDTLEGRGKPFQKKENKEIGTKGMELGSRQSERMIRVYDLHGFNRLEMEIKGKRAQSITNQLLSTEDTENWPIIMQSHLLDYVDFYTDWWREFIANNKRANLKITKPALVEFVKSYSWIKNQASPTLSVLFDMLPFEAFLEIIEYGRQRRGHKFDLILENSKSIIKEFFNNRYGDVAIQPKTIDAISPSNKLPDNITTKIQNVGLSVLEYQPKSNPIFQKLEIGVVDFERILDETSNKDLSNIIVKDKFQSSGNEKPAGEETEFQNRSTSKEKEVIQQIS